MTYLEKLSALTDLVSKDVQLVAFLKNRKYINQHVGSALIEEHVTSEKIESFQFNEEKPNFDELVIAFKEGLRKDILSEIDALLPKVEQKPKGAK